MTEDSEAIRRNTMNNCDSKFKSLEEIEWLLKNHQLAKLKQDKMDNLNTHSHQRNFIYN